MTIQPAQLNLLYMLKAPEPGRVKTRLAQSIGEDEAVLVYKQLVEHTFEALKGDWASTVHYTPESSGPFFKTWLKTATAFQLQVEGDLGTRMQAAVEHAFLQRPSAVCLLGGDCPYICAAHLEEALDALSTHDLVVGPALDGGYYTLLLKRSIPELFQTINWGTETVLKETLAIAKRLKLTVHQLQALEDVDDLESYQRASKRYDSLGSFKT